MIKKILPYILIVLIFANFFAPFGVALNQKNVLKIENRVVEAVGRDLAEKRAREAAEKAKAAYIEAHKTDADVQQKAQEEYDRVYKEVFDKEYSGITPEQHLATLQKAVTDAYVLLESAKASGSQTRINAAELNLRVAEKNLADFQGTGVIGGSGNDDENGVNQEAKSPPSDLPLCNAWPPTWFKGCLVRIFYYVLYVPTSYLFALAGTLFDHTFAYSVNDESYRSAFVIEGWGIVRDFCNMFFIFVMLYIAFATILNLNGSKTKEMIINVVIVGLLINFSLFATRIIIDASNILARVFYTSDAITQTDKGGPNASNLIAKNGIIPLSAALVNEFDPQSLLINSKKATIIQSEAKNQFQEQEGVGVGTYIIIIFLASGVNIVGFIVFLTVGLIFIVRVVGLWLAMIFAPLAFFSYTVPALGGIQRFGHKNWWPETLKLAFLAPIFIFFLYLILAFVEKGLNLIDARNETGLTYVIAIVLPFAFIMVLLLEAKKIAVKWAGSMGEAVAKAGSTVGGLALGAGIGAGAVAMRGTIGKLGSKIGESEWAKKNGRIGRMVGDVGKWTASSSFDVRSTKLGANAAKGLGADMGKAKEGGYTKHKEDVYKKRRERAESIKLGENSKEVKELHANEEQLSNLKSLNINDTNRIDGSLTALRVKLGDKRATSARANEEIAKLKAAGVETTDPKFKAAIDASDEAAKDEKKIQDDINKFVSERLNLRTATGKYSHRTGDGKVNREGYEKFVDDSKTENTKLEAEITDLKEKMDKETDELEKLLLEDRIKKNNEIIKSNKTALEEMKEAIADKNRGFAKVGEARSLDNLDFNIIPESKFKVDQIDAERIGKYAEGIRNRWFNQKANDKAAHEMIMGSEIKK